MPGAGNAAGQHPCSLNHTPSIRRNTLPTFDLRERLFQAGPCHPAFGMPYFVFLSLSWHADSVG